MHPVQLSVNDLTGGPAKNAVVEFFQTDPGTSQVGLIPITKGIGRVELPAGHYVAVTTFTDLRNGTQVTAVREVGTSFTVSSTDTTKVTVDEKSATNHVTVATPRPSTTDLLGLNFIAQHPDGSVIRYTTQFAPDSTTPMYVNTLPALSVGKLRYFVQWGGISPKPTDHYRYDVAFASDNGIPADQAYTVKPNQLATVHDQFTADPAAPNKPNSILSSAADPILHFGDGQFGNAPVGGTQIDYLGTADGGIWLQNFSTATGVGYLSGQNQYMAGHEYTVTWAHGPLAPNFAQSIGPVRCAACVAGNHLQLRFMAGGGEPDQDGLLLGNPHSASFVLYRNGTKLYGNTGENAFEGTLPSTTIPAGGATYRAVYDVDLTGVAGFSQSTVTHTDLTFRYTPNPGPGNEIPAADGCIGRTAHTPCEALPVLSLHYNLATDLHNTSDKPKQVLHLNVGHASYDRHGSHAPITSTTVSISFDGGKNWRPATVSGTNGSYTVTWDNPSSAAGTKPALKVTATDASGGSISQTILNAYTIAQRH